MFDSGRVSKEDMRSFHATDLGVGFHSRAHVFGPRTRAMADRTSMGAAQVCYFRYMCNGTSVLFRGSGKVSKKKEGELLRT